MTAILEQPAPSLATDGLVVGAPAHTGASTQDCTSTDAAGISAPGSEPSPTETFGHKVTYRVSINTLLWGRFYFTLFAGPERRSRERLEEEGQTSIPRQAILISAAITTLISFSAFGLFCTLYLLKAAMRFNLFHGVSPFHPLYELFLRG
jgi:hypothetical protein